MLFRTNSSYSTKRLHALVGVLLPEAAFCDAWLHMGLREVYPPEGSDEPLEELLRHHASSPSRSFLSNGIKRRVALSTAVRSWPSLQRLSQSGLLHALRRLFSVRGKLARHEAAHFERGESRAGHCVVSGLSGSELRLVHRLEEREG